jgi:nickel-dependent lactate racemase
MGIALAYGRTGLPINLSSDVDVITPHFVAGLPNEEAALRNAIHIPIGSPSLKNMIANAGRPAGSLQTVVVHTDITRATPNDRILPVILSELESSGIQRKNITLLNGLGTHRPQTETELRSMLGKDIVDNYRCLQHDCFDDKTLVPLGETSLGHPVRINRHYVDADIKILTGFIEPHFFAGFSGGPKAVLPSLAGSESVFTNHNAAMIDHPKSTWGITRGNPIWEEMREVALRTNPSFLLNVALNDKKQISGVFAGDLLQAHSKGCDFVKKNAMAAVNEPYDIVITTNSGYPLDLNLYQAVKGMSAASQIVRQGGTIIVAAACEDGLPDHGLYASLLAEAGSPEAILELISKPGYSAQDQWQVQIQAQIQLKAKVYVYSDGLTDEQIKSALLLPCRDIEATVSQLRLVNGSKVRICVIPEGPQTIPYLNTN